jgi:hypothetical protein
MPAEETILMEDAEIIFRNFEGKEGKYNRKGDRNFCVLLPEALATTLSRDGWSIKTLKPRDPDDEPRPYIPVSVGFKNRPPKIFLVTSRSRTPLTEENVEILDWVDIKQVDLIIRPYDWTVNGESGRKAYVKSLFVVVHEDYLEEKYAGVPEISATAHGADIVDGEIVDEWVGERKAIGR